MARYAGMDVSSYPGAPIMGVAWATSNIVWTGMYLDSPAPVPGELPSPKANNGHNRMGGIGGNPVGGWMRAWSELQPSWGILPIYWGQQDPANNDGPIDLRDAIALANGDDAAAKARSASLPAGAVIYVDWEIGGPPSAAGKKYVRLLLHRIAEAGYRPGVYCHPPASIAFRPENPGLYAWSVNLLPSNPSDITIVTGQLTLRTPAIDEAGGELADPDAIARQWKFNVSAPPLSPIPGFPAIDLDVAVVQNPAFPEQKNQPGEIRSGRVAITTDDASNVSAFAVRRGDVRRAVWSSGSGSIDSTLNTSAFGRQFNPFSTPAATRVGALQVFCGLGFDPNEGDGIWRVQALERTTGAPWQHVTIANPSVVIDPLPGVLVIPRQGSQIEVFAVQSGTRNVASARRPGAGSWTTLDVLRSPIGPTATSPVRLTNRPAAVSPLTDRIDLFWAGDDGLLQATYSVTAGIWAIPFRLGDPTVRLHPLANIVAVNRDVGTVDVFYIGRRDGDANWRLYNTWYIVNPIAFIPVPATQMIGGASVALEPMAPIAAGSRSADFIDVFAVGDNGGLHNTFWQRTPPSWSALRSVGGSPGSPTRLISVDGCVCKTTSDVEVVATGGDSMVYGSRWDTSLPDYTTLSRLVPLDV